MSTTQHRWLVLSRSPYSISNQKKLLTKAAKDAGHTSIVTYTDDGVSGVTMNRLGYQAMIAELEKDHAAAVFVKDLSRLGRNYIEVGRLAKEFFPAHEIRLVAISDGIDTNDGENELAPIRNLFNERYARDDKLFERIYEDNVSGKLTDERFARMSARYDAEQKELAEKIKATRKALEQRAEKTLTKDMFLSIVRKYTRAKKLTQTMINELIDHI